MSDTPRAKPRSTLADRVYHWLFSRISNGEYPTNQRLPSEYALAEEFGVSRPVLRTALERLKSEGLVYSRQGAGNYVRASQAVTVGFARVETLADVQRFYEFRLTIETAAAGVAAERHDQAALAKIADALEMMRDATGSHLHREDADFAFHLAITEAANNHYYETAMRALRDHINVGMKLHGQSLLSDGAKALEDVLAEHSAIYKAVNDRQSANASKLMRQHLERSRDRLFGGGLLDLRIEAVT